MKFGTPIKLLPIITFYSSEKITFLTENEIMNENDILEDRFLIPRLVLVFIVGNETGIIRIKYSEK